MKKLMMAAAIVCAAVCAQAATMNWATWGYYMDGEEQVWPEEGGQAYLIMVTDAKKFAVADDLTITGGEIVDSAAFEGGSVYGANEFTWADGTYNFAMVLTTDGEDITVPTSGLYGIDDNEGSFYSVDWSSATGGDFIPEHSGIEMASTVTPEPTSGLLLLLGMAGLALKRKRA